MNDDLPHWKAFIARAARTTFRIVQRPFYPPTAPKALAFTSICGIVTMSAGIAKEIDFATNLGLGLSAGAFAFGVFGAWIQGKQISTVHDQVHKVLFNDVTLRVFSNIQENAKLSKRMHEGNRKLKDEIGNALCQIKLNGRKSDFFGEFIAKRNIFVESGSTFAYLALTHNKYLNGEIADEPSSDGRQTVCTNNILVFMVLVFQWKCRTRLYPGTPAGKYGATFGTGYGTKKIKNEEELVFQRIKKDEMWNFLLGKAQSDAEGAAEDQKPEGTIRNYGIQVALLAASKLHLKWGPHVGSVENICFKKALFEYCQEKGVPGLMIIDSSKIELAYESVSKDCRFMFADDADKSPYRQADLELVGKTKANDGFERFAKEIGRGNIFLFVGYGKMLHTPAEVDALRKRLEAYNDAERKGGGQCLVHCSVESSTEIDMLVVHALYAPKTEMAKNIQEALAARVHKNLE